jgi:putative serine protease PepD
MTPDYQEQPSNVESDEAKNDMTSPQVSAPQPPPPGWQHPSAPQQMAEEYGPLPVCDYTGEDEAPCEEPATQKRWSSAAVVTAASMGAIVGGLLVAAGIVWALGLVPGTRPIGSGVVRESTPAVQAVTISTRNQPVDVAQAVAKKAVPSVVSVAIQQATVDPYTGARAYTTAGNGSGVIIRKDGYILTNNHVVEGADRILVTVGVEDKVATVVGTDPTTDLAVLKIDGTNYPAVDVGTSKNLQVGQFVLAVGSPFGLEKTVTSGIISALQRSEFVQDNNGQTAYTNLIQTDAAINPGNSGGALVDENGQLVGINALIQSPSGGMGAAQSAGIGFAIPVDFAIDIANQIISTGKATHPYIGVSTASVTQDVAAQYGLPVSSGAIVQFVAPGGPADAAGIKRGDIIVKIGDVRVTGVSDVYAGIRAHKIGDTVPVSLVRADQTLTMNVVLASDASRK